VNDLYGHAAGNDALRSVAVAIRQELREIDLGARLGGDEFGVLAPRTTKESARVLAERLRARVANAAADPRSGGTTISIGVASVASGDRRRTADSLMAAADQALYLAKRAGGNRVEDGHPPVTIPADETTSSVIGEGDTSAPYQDAADRRLE
jgi:diguanylate cyclase (GGDEF)-like protein